MMDIKLINPFLAAAMHVLKTMAQVDATICSGMENRSASGLVADLSKVMSVGTHLAQSSTASTEIVDLRHLHMEKIHVAHP
jgi:hypothetical protein